MIPADSVLTAAAVDAELPDSFVTQLETDLDNQIDLDGGFILKYLNSNKKNYRLNDFSSTSV